MKITALIVTYNKLDLLKENLEALQKQTFSLNNIIVVDNNSDEDTRKYLESLEDKIKYIRLNENLGGAGGFNAGMKFFMENSEDDYLWIMDDDTIPDKTALEQLIANFKNEEFGFLCSKVAWTDESIALMNIPTPNPFKDDKSIVPVKSCSFVSVLFPKKVIKKVGYPIKDFFIWGDDVEFTERISKNYSSYCVKDSIVIHKMASNVGANITNDSVDRLKRYYYNYRNMSFVSKKRGGFKLVKFYLSYFKNILKIIFMAKNYKFKRIKIMTKGFTDGLVFNPKIEMFEEDKKGE